MSHSHKKQLDLLAARQREHAAITPELPADATPEQIVRAVLAAISAGASRSRDRLAAQGLLMRMNAGEFSAPAADNGELLAIAQALRDSYERDYGESLAITTPEPTHPESDVDITQLLADTRRGSAMSRVSACLLVLQVLRGDFGGDNVESVGISVLAATVNALRDA